MLPGRLECKTSLEQCMKVFLFDAHREQGFTNHSCQSLNNDGAVQVTVVLTVTCAVVMVTCLVLMVLCLAVTVLSLAVSVLCLL